MRDRFSSRNSAFIRLLRTLVAPFLIALPLHSIALPFSNIYVLGDSLSDQGNLFIATAAVAGAPNALPSADHYFNGRFSNGPVYTDILAQRLGLPLGPSIVGGNNFAYGGARTTYNVVESTVGGPLPAGLFPWSLNAEIAAFQGRGISDPNALYVVFSGSNDVADILTRNLNPASVIGTGVGAIVAAVQAFKAAGAQTVLVPNLPDLGLTPAFLGSAAASAAATALSAQFNALLHAQLSTIADLDIIEFDTFGLIRNVVANPADFGLSNVTAPCYSGFVTPNPNATECANPDEYLFWDIVHPTSTVHLALANALLAVIPAVAVPEPSTSALVLLSAVLLFGMGRRVPVGGLAQRAG